MSVNSLVLEPAIVHRAAPSTEACRLVAVEQPAIWRRVAGIALIGWSFFAKGVARELCSQCHALDPIQATWYVPPAQHLEPVARAASGAGSIVRSDEGRLVFGAVAAQRLVDAGIEPQVLRPLPLGLYTTDDLFLPVIDLDAIASGPGCAACGRVALVPREARPPVLAEQPRGLARSSQLLGSGATRQWWLLADSGTAAALGSA